MKRTVNRPKSGQKAGVGESAAAFRSTFGERFTALLNLFPTRAVAGEIAGVHPDQFPKYARETVKVPLQVVAKLAVQKGVSLDWLVSGDGTMFTSGDSPTEQDGDVVQVPVLDIRAGAGSEQWVVDEAPISTLALPRAFLLRNGIRPAHARLMFGVGTSMEPTIKDRAPLVVDTSDLGERDDIYVMRRGSGIIVKRLQHLANGSVILKSDNPAWGPETLPRDEADELRVLGRVGLVLQSI